MQISQRDVTVSITGVDEKVYDGARTATGEYALSGALQGDALTLVGGAFTFDNANVGENKVVIFDRYQLSDARNYRLNNASAIWRQGVITPRDVTVDWEVENEYVYNGQSQASGVRAYFIDETGFRSSALVSYGQGREFLQAGEYLAVADTTSANYRVAEGATKTLRIIPATITLTFSPNPRTYNGKTNAGYGYKLQGVLEGDVVSIASSTCQFDTKDVGRNKTVTLSDVALDNSNYRLDKTSYTVKTGSIQARALTWEGGEVVDKTYDGGTDATFVGGTLTGMIEGDDLVVTATCQFPSAEPGAYETTVTFVCSGADALNYRSIAQRTQSATIKPRAVLDAGRYEVQEGCDFIATVAAQGGVATEYAWRLDDSSANGSDASFYGRAERLNLPIGEHYLYSRVEVNGIWSDETQGILTVEHIPPAIRVDSVALIDQALRLDLAFYSFGARTARYGTINWGDGRTSDFALDSSRSCLAHYYESTGADVDYDVTLELFDDPEAEKEIFFLTSCHMSATKLVQNESSVDFATFDPFEELDGLVLDRSVFKKRRI